MRKLLTPLQAAEVKKKKAARSLLVSRRQAVAALARAEKALAKAKKAEAELAAAEAAYKLALLSSLY